MLILYWWNGTIIILFALKHPLLFLSSNVTIIFPWIKYRYGLNIVFMLMNFRSKRVLFNGKQSTICLPQEPMMNFFVVYFIIQVFVGYMGIRGSHGNGSSQHKKIKIKYWSRFNYKEKSIMMKFLCLCLVVESDSTATGAGTPFGLGRFFFLTLFCICI